MSLITRMRKQDAVYWAFKRFNQAGNPEHAPPIAIKVRWVDEQTNYSGPSGEQLVSTATVYVDRDMPLDGFLFLGTLPQAPFHPKDVAGAVQIRGHKNTPNIRNTEVLRRVYV